MILELTDRQERLRAEAEAFGMNEVAPLAATIDDRNVLPIGLIRRALECGLTDFAGAGAPGGDDRMAAAVVFCAIARSSAAVALRIGVTQLVRSALDRHGTPSQRERWDAVLATPESGAAIVVSDLGTHREQQSDGWVVRNLRAEWVAGLQVVDAGLFVDASPGSDGEAVAWIQPLSTGDVVRLERPDPLGVRGAGWADAIVERSHVESMAVLGEDSTASATAARWVLGQAQVLCAAVAVGVGRAALDQAVAATRAREDRGSQAVRFALADASTELDAAWLLALKAASSAGDSEPILRPMAKFLATEAAVRAADIGLQLTAPQSYRRGSIPERLSRDARALDSLFGTSHRARRETARGLGLEDG